MIDKKYCTNCQIWRPTNYGKVIKAGKINRWRCTNCAEKTNKAFESEYLKNVKLRHLANEN